MKKSIVISLSIVGALVLLACVGLPLYFAFFKSTASSPVSPIITPQEECVQNGYIWDQSNNVCTSITPQQQCINEGYTWDSDQNTCIHLNCIASVDKDSGIITGSILNVDNTACVNIGKDTFITIFAQEHLKELCQEADKDFVNYLVSGVGLRCVKASGCNKVPYTIGVTSPLNNCIYMTLQPGDGKGCVPPTDNQIQDFCNYSLNGCPSNSSLDNSCDDTQPCYNPTTGFCLAASPTPGCRPSDKNWQWLNGVCVDTTVTKSISLTISNATLDKIEGTYTNTSSIPTTTKQIWVCTLSDDSTKPVTNWQQVFTPSVDDNTFTIIIQQFSKLSTPTKVGVPYNLTVQVYVSANDPIPYELGYVSIQPTTITLEAAPVTPSEIASIQPNLDRNLANALLTSNNINNAVNAANNNSDSTNNPTVFQLPDSSKWDNGLPTVPTLNNSYLIVPCTTAYCVNTLNDPYAMLIFAWKSITSLSTSQIADIKKCSPEITNPQISYAVKADDDIIGDRLQGGTWFQPILSDPTITTTFKLLAYVWDSKDGDQGFSKSKCTSSSTFVVSTPTTMYSAEICYNIQPLQGPPIPGNFMLYKPGDNMCSEPLTKMDELSARDFSCMISSGTDPSVTSMNMYGCNDKGYNKGYDCDAASQMCESIVASTDVRLPDAGQDNKCPPLDQNLQIPCGGTQYCQRAACNCPTGIPWDECGVSSYANFGQTGKAINKDRWVERMQSIKELIDTYSLLCVAPSVQGFVNTMGDVTETDLKNLWDHNYGVDICPLSSNTDWKAPSPESCDVSSDTNCKQQNLCGTWAKDTDTNQTETGLYIKPLYVYPSEDLNPSCCNSNSEYFAGCCCTSSDNRNTCAELKEVCLSVGIPNPTWCDPNV